MLIIRQERAGDEEAIHRVVEAAFGGSAEAELVDELRKAGLATISLIAEVDREIVGHILFSPVRLEPEAGDLRLLGLAPMAVSPGRQRSGIGSGLIREGLDEAARSGYEGVVVLGHPEYYPKFGFRPANLFGIRSIYNVRDEAFMALELKPGALEGHSGTIHYADQFDRF
ncbi:MAG: N-acetyltransferase [Acidobacteriota bacterium]|nr:MAG: N-acetyltransferase [Acidobacteriota bacterium]